MTAERSVEDIWAMLLGAVSACGIGDTGRAGDLTVELVHGRPAAEVYTAMSGLARLAANAVNALNADGPPREDGGPWTLADLLPPPAGDQSADSGAVFAHRFLTAYGVDCRDIDETVTLFNGIAAGGSAVVVFCMAHLVTAVAAVNERAIARCVGADQERAG